MAAIKKEIVLVSPNTSREFEKKGCLLYTSAAADE